MLMCAIALTTIYSLISHDTVYDIGILRRV
jgi:hypothetical protein